VTGWKQVSVTPTEGGSDHTGGVRIGLFGGTFDPPHLGHRRAVEASRDALGLNEVRVIVAGDPWQKSEKSARDGEEAPTPALHRLAMAQLAFGDMDDVVVDDLEIRRHGPTYTVDTLEELTAADRQLVLILGEDAAAGIATWHRHADLLALAELAVVDRPGREEQSGSSAAPLELPEGWSFRRVSMVPVAVSSTGLRRLIDGGGDLAGLVSPAVVDYARSHGLYRERRDEP
jgi:nicotinate-nucleotide adenylyltransferase